MDAGRPSIYSPELAAAICARLAEGESLRKICAEPEMPCRATVAKWVTDDVEGFSGQYTRAREVGADSLVDEILELADDAKSDPQRSRLQVDARKWYASKVVPKRYGDKLQHTGDGGDAPILFQVVTGVERNPTD